MSQQRQKIPVGCIFNVANETKDSKGIIFRHRIRKIDKLNVNKNKIS